MGYIGYKIVPRNLLKLIILEGELATFSAFQGPRSWCHPTLGPISFIYSCIAALRPAKRP